MDGSGRLFAFKFRHVDYKFTHSRLHPVTALRPSLLPNYPPELARSTEPCLAFLPMSFSAVSPDSSVEEDEFLLASIDTRLHQLEAEQAAIQVRTSLRA